MIRNLTVILLLAALASPLAAQDAASSSAASPSSPLLFIERIEVRNANRVSPDVVIAESRLREGHEYAEAELRDAATRLARLPFLLSVDFALERGSERGRHVLVLTINETKPFFFLLDLVPYFQEDSSLDVDYSNDRSGSGENLALGARWFVGRRGAVHLGFSGVGHDREFARDYASFSVGYTQYDIFGSRAFATLNLKRPIEGFGEGLISPQVVVGVPISANQTLTVQYDETRFGEEKRTVEGVDYPIRFGQKIVSATMAYNTTNEPFFPTRGTLLQVTPMYGWTDGARILHTIVGGPNGTEVAHAAYHTHFFGAEAGATRYWELTDRDSVWGNVRAEWARESYNNQITVTELDRTARYGSLGIGYSHSLWTPEERVAGDSRFEFTARYSNRDVENDPPAFFSRDTDVTQVGFAWLRRTSWGTLRLGGGYAW